MSVLWYRPNEHSKICKVAPKVVKVIKANNERITNCELNLFIVLNLLLKIKLIKKANIFYTENAVILSNHLFLRILTIL